MTSDVELSKVKTLLTSVRDTPVNTVDGAEDILQPLYLYLMNIPPSAPDNTYHWFCSRANQLTIGAATFLLRLFAYDSPRVDDWKRRLKSCLSGCCQCIRGFGEVKASSRTTYFGAFSDDVLRSFYSKFDDWELSVVVETLVRTGIDLSSSRLASRTPQEVPQPLLYHMVSNMRVFRDPRVLPLIRACPPISTWPLDPPPPGLFVLVMDESSAVRQWAKAQITKSTQVPMLEHQFVAGHELALQAVTRALTLSREGEETTTDSVISNSFSSDSSELWAGFSHILRHLPTEVLAKPSEEIGYRRIVTGHLHDIGRHFSDILKCLLFLLKRLGNKLWQGEGPEYPQVVFDAIKDNPSFSDMLQDLKSAGEKPWFLSWFGEYLATISDSAIYRDVLARIVDFLCEELQHERFQEARPAIMYSAVRVSVFIFLSDVILNVRKTQSDETLSRRMAVSSVLDIHAEVFISVAFSRLYASSQWKEVRGAARELITTSLTQDANEISKSITTSCEFLAGRTKVFPVCAIREQMWKKTYESLQTNDTDGVIAIIAIIAQFSHIDFLNKACVQTPFDAINRCLDISRSGFLDVVSKLANYNQRSFVLDVLGRPGVARDIMVLMLSPIEDLQGAAKTLVGQAFDVDVRIDCFRALLSNLSDSSFEGIFSFLERYIHYAPQVPEACSLSKSLVQCLTDVIEVLCSSPDGLLHDSSFLRSKDKEAPAAQIPRLWNLMTRSITVIFKRTPLWSEYFEIPDMTVWMRDALIFGRDLLAQWRVMESASVTATDESSSLLTGKVRKLSRMGKNMMSDLQPVLTELARWLRLSDEELLHQSFALLQTLLECFRTTDIPPSEASLTKLNRHVEASRKDKSGISKTKLDASRIAQLEDALTSFEEKEVEVVSVVRAPPARPTKPHELPPQKAQAAARKQSDVVRRKPTNNDQLKPDVMKGAFPKFQRLSTSTSTSVSKAPTLLSAPSSEYSSDSGSEAETVQGGLVALGKFQRSPKVKKPTERRQVKLLDIQNQAKSATMERLHRREDARRRALRLKPDITGLHRTLLSWNYDHDGPNPPTVAQKAPLLHVPDTFQDYQHYLRVFEPLLLLECWSQIIQAKENVEGVYDCKITSKHFTDDFVDFDATISEPVQKDWRLGETDVVLLRHPEGKKSIMMKVQSFRTTPFGSQMGLRCFVHSTMGDIGLHINTVWSLKKAFSLSTLHREYGALMALPHYDLFQMILTPKLSGMPPLQQHEVQHTMSAHHVNEPQARAIIGSLKIDGFALIQGPPGTGKTSTICGLVEAFLQKRPRATTSIHVGKTATSSESVKKILLCAPSNAAIDEIAGRLKEGYRGPQRKASSLKVVRVGTEKAIDISVKEVSLDYLVEQKLNGQTPNNTSKDAHNEINVLRGEIEQVKQIKQQKLEELASVRDNNARMVVLEEEIKKLNSRRMTLTQQFDRLKDQQKSDSRTLDAIRRRVRMEVLQEADVICCTLSGAGHETLEQLDFEMVIIDEAAQSIELSSLIPLKFPCQRCIMVGDPQQLAPTVLSQEACKYRYNQSLFVRLQKHRPDAVHLLSIQYRMHPDISRLPSRIFYQGRLLDGPDMDVKTKQPWHLHPKFGTYRFFNVNRGLETSTNGHSLRNATESQVALALYARLCKEFSDIDFDFRVGIVSMYRGQVMELQRAFEQRFGRDIKGRVHFHTVDGFQGQEKDIIILSCVRAGPGVQSVGFLSDVRRMNVAITRARSSLFILGHAPTLERSDENWRKIVQDARERSLLTEVRRFPSPSKPKKQPVVTLPPRPDDLVTPKSFAESSRRPPSSKPSQTIEEQPSMKDPPANLTIPRDVGQKRRLAEGVNGEPSTSGPHETRTTQPPPKRFKKEKGSIFIPKKNKVMFL
ncbi:SEN1 N terminal-domain-containing protein [Suillus fuscotomentosus]|uniref:SEN1 N terminal-domain-containing protein n=1 Tax=Suillus fuscotomentosus TaxID=1912939 RepID=A0AAD4EK12_9AGAM|nr:SEN1 N terminal-domain-containing protein [Suillus fuscotomentosus]KAG1906409.1 SEN1 N terminal-domain-containing protein [Suillus fuscotomentosus]